MKKINLIGLMLIFACGCATANRTTSSGPAPQISVSVLQNASLDQWSVRYELSEPVHDLVFDRQTNRFRKKHWRVKTPGLEIQEINGKERIASVSGQSFREVVLELDSYYTDTPKDYEFFQAFSDGSLVMYTGHFNACPTSIDCDTPIRFLFTGRKNAHVVLAGEVHRQEADWTDATGRGTYVYFGKIKPLEQSHLTAIIDPSLPRWLRSNLLSKLPKLFEFYTASTQQELSFKPFIFINYSARGVGTDNHGGTLPGLIQMTIEGKGWAKKSSESLIHVLRFFGHESAHVWNGQLFPYTSGDMWMHEGGADAFSYLALLRLKIIDLQQFLDFQSTALNDCTMRLKSRPLREVTEDPDFKAFYRCGSILALITHAATKRHDPKKSLFSFWNSLFALSKRESRAYTEDMYFKTLDQMSASPSLSQGFRRFLDGPIDDPGQYLRDTLKSVGVTIGASSSDGSRDYQKTQAMNALRILMSHDCGGRRSLTFGNTGIQVDPLDGCQRFNRSLLVTHIAGFRVTNQGTRVYDRVRDTCREGETVTLTIHGEGTPFVASCPKDIPLREKPWAVEAVPL